MDKGTWVRWNQRITHEQDDVAGAAADFVRHIRTAGYRADAAIGMGVDMKPKPHTTFPEGHFQRVADEVHRTCPNITLHITDKTPGNGNHTIIFRPTASKPSSSPAAGVSAGDNKPAADAKGTTSTSSTTSEDTGTNVSVENVTDADKHCSCGRTTAADNSSLLICGGCHNAHYCGKICQKTDWKAHKKVCKPSSTPS